MTGEIRRPAMASEAAASPDVHEHQWAALEFVLEDGRPWVRRECARCGAVSRYRAWERYWDPGSDTRAHTTAQPATAADDRR